MFYKFDNNTLVWRKDLKKTKIALSVVAVLMFATFLLGRFYRFTTLDEYEKELLVVSLEQEKNEFTEDKFAGELKRLNVRFPHIVMAQSILETGGFKSNIFKENHNLFGMKQANIRINTAKGTQNGHAYYDNWYESVYDYAFYQCRYLSTIRSEQEYFTYLSTSYAESGDKYVTSLKDVIEKHKLKNYFKNDFKNQIEFVIIIITLQ
jgi:uncharacterized FlgJ-related protein